MIILGRSEEGKRTKLGWLDSRDNMRCHRSVAQQWSFQATQANGDGAETESRVR